MTETTHDIEMMKEKTKGKKVYKTSDIALASTILIKEHDMLSIEPVPKKPNSRGDIFHFVFEDWDGREKMVLEYSTNNPNLQVPPNTFRNTMRLLKEQCKNYGTR